MPHYNKIFNKVPIQVPNKSGFDMSHENLFTSKVGTLVPCLVDELLPNDSITLGVSSQVQLPPMATDFYGRVSAKFEAFFVPFRLLYGGWQELITHPVNGDNYPSGTTQYQKAKYLPKLVPSASSQVAAGTLADYLGCKWDSGYPSEIPNPLPFLAYHKIYDDWYRDSRIQQPLFARSTIGNLTAANMPFRTDYSSAPATLTDGFADNSSIYSLRQRNWSRDYFTNATPKPQAGDPAVLSFGVNAQGSFSGNRLLIANTDGSFSRTKTTPDFDGTNTVSSQADAAINLVASFSISALRAANSLQQWLERNNVAGARYGDQIRAQFGIYPADAVLDRALYLGSQTFNVYNKSIYMSSERTNEQITNNPFAGIASKYANSMSVGQGSLVDKFTASEHGFIFVIFSLVPHAYYGSGTRKYISRSSMADFAFPLLAGMGDQPISDYELTDDTIGGNSVFGYTQRYSEYKFMQDEVHGLLRDGQSLDVFALQRSFATAPSLGSSFLQIPTNFMDQVAATSGDISTYGCWVDSYFKYKKSSTLPAYSIPTLGDMKDTHTEVIPNGGTRL